MRHCGLSRKVLSMCCPLDGADINARPDEAVSWGKIKSKGESIKVFGDATILFPLIVAKTFASA